MKLKLLQGIANNVLEYGCCSNPVDSHTMAFDIEVDLLTGKITPNMKGDDVEEFYTDVHKWFLKDLEKIEIPIKVIEKAVITIKDSNPVCTIVAKGKTYSSSSKYFVQ